MKLKNSTEMKTELSKCGKNFKWLQDGWRLIQRNSEWPGCPCCPEAVKPTHGKESQVGPGTSPLSALPQRPKGKLVNCHSVTWVFLLRCQCDTPIVYSPSCPLWLIPSDPNFLSHLWTENNKQGVEGVYHDALHPPGCSPHTEAMLAREKTVRNLTAGLAGAVHLHEHPQFQSVRESSSGMRRSHFYTAEPQNLLSVDKPQIWGNLSNLKMNKQ